MVVARRRQGGFLQLPCSLGFRLAFSATGGARLRPPAAFEKSGGKPAGKLFRVSNGLCRRAAHRERPAGFVHRKGAEKQAFCPKGRKNSSVPGGAARARSALKERRPRPLAGPPLFRLAGRGPGGPPAAKRRRPPPAQPWRQPPTLGQRGPGGPTAVAWRRRKDGAVTGGGGVWQARGGPVGRPGAAKQKSGPRGLWPLGPLSACRKSPAKAGLFRL